MALGGIRHLWRLASASTGGASRWRVCYQWGLPRLVWGETDQPDIILVKISLFFESLSLYSDVPDSTLCSDSRSGHDWSRDLSDIISPVSPVLQLL